MMPYIDEESRERLHAERLPIPFTVGELNYLICELSVKYLSSGEMRYSRINDVIGVLECAKMEMYRRLAIPYEDEAMKRNGDVFPRSIGGRQE